MTKQERTKPINSLQKRHPRTRRDNQIIQQIADRAVRLYERYGIEVRREYIVMELRLVHEEIIPLRLTEFLNADDENFAHDIGGIHRHVVIGKHTRLADCFVPRFARA
jgi:uncharacterized protein DUF6874